MQSPEEIALTVSEDVFTHERYWNPQTFAPYIAAALRAYGDERAAEERERARDWRPSTERPADWERAYPTALTGKTIEAMQYLAHWALAQPTPPLSTIAAADHVWSIAAALRALPRE